MKQLLRSIMQGLSYFQWLRPIILPTLLVMAFTQEYCNMIVSCNSEYAATVLLVLPIGMIIVGSLIYYCEYMYAFSLASATSYFCIIADSEWSRSPSNWPYLFLDVVVGLLFFWALFHCLPAMMREYLPRLPERPKYGLLSYVPQPYRSQIYGRLMTHLVTTIAEIIFVAHFTLQLIAKTR